MADLKTFGTELKLRIENYTRYFEYDTSAAVVLGKPIVSHAFVVTVVRGMIGENRKPLLPEKFRSRSSSGNATEETRPWNLNCKAKVAILCNSTQVERDIKRYL